jgi:hypothetical protein
MATVQYLVPEQGCVNASMVVLAHHTCGVVPDLLFFPGRSLNLRWRCASWVMTRMAMTASAADLQAVVAATYILTLRSLLKAT